MKKCQTSLVFDCSSHHFSNTVPKKRVFSRRKCYSSHRFEETVTPVVEHRHIFEKAEEVIMYICFISRWCPDSYRDRTEITGSANPLAHSPGSDR